MSHPLRAAKLIVCLGCLALIAPSAFAQLDPETILEQSRQPKLLPSEIMASIPTTPNPWASLRPDGTFVDYNYWGTRSYLAAVAGAAQNKPAKIKITGNAGRGTVSVSKFGTGPSQSDSAQVTGTFDLPAEIPLTQNAEDEGSIPLATETGLVPGNAVLVDGVIGDGPFGLAGSGSGDFDFFVIRDVVAGDTLTVDVDTALPFAPLDPAVALYDATGQIVAFNDDSGGTFDSFVAFTAPADGDYYVSVGTFGNPILFDPFDSSSGGGVFDFFGTPNEGPYSISIGLNYFDEQLITFTPKKGDVIGAALNGVAGELALIDRSGLLRQGSQSAANSFFDTGSPLPQGPVAVGHVVDRAGLFTLRVRGLASGPYTVDLGAHLPELRTADRGAVQTIFLDFDGETLDLRGSLVPATFPVPIIVSLSPLSSFLPFWGLAPVDEDAVIDAIVERVEESLVADIDRFGPNPKFEIRLLNSRDHADPFGQPNVSRVIVGGTIPELGVNTIGIAQSIDVGNYDTEETAFVLLDVLSGLLPTTIDLNGIPRAPGVSIIDIIGVGVGEIVAHEAGHYLGCWHTDQFNGIANIMDQGGNLEFSILGLGPDGVFGTADDTNVEFVRDVFNPNEPFTGVEDTNSAIAYGATTPK